MKLVGWLVAAALVLSVLTAVRHHPPGSVPDRPATISSNPHFHAPAWLHNLMHPDNQPATRRHPTKH